MLLTEVYRLKPGSPVWIWVIHLGKGRWWPGIVEIIRAINDKPRIIVRFECRVTRGHQYRWTVRAGIATTAMRYLEHRDPHSKANDEPHFVPPSLLERPEELEVPQLRIVSNHRQGNESQQGEVNSRSPATKESAEPHDGSCSRAHK